MKPINWQKVWLGIRKYVLNKYILTLIIFALVMLFAGEQSILNRFKRARQISELEQQKESYIQGINEAQHEIDMLQSTDSLERFAREHYLMHTPEEDVYIVEE